MTQVVTHSPRSSVAQKRARVAGAGPDASASCSRSTSGLKIVASEALKATRSGVAPSFAAAFVEDAFDAELLRLVDDVCAVRTGSGGLLLLFKKK